MQKSPIMVIDDDVEDLELIAEAFKDLGIQNDLLCFNIAEDALNFLKESNQQPLFILCDVNMNSINGFELRQKLYDDEKLRLKSIPFLFLSTGGNRTDVTKAYDLSVQGYFRKPTTYEGIVQMLDRIIKYWALCNHPNMHGLRNE